MLAHGTTPPGGPTTVAVTSPVADLPVRQSSSPPRRWTLWPLRVVTTVFTIQVFAQAALAGSFLSGHYGALHTHELNGLVLAGFGWLLPVTAILAWRPGRWAAWPMLAAVVAYVTILVQLILGFSRALAVHVPVGVLLLVALAVLCTWAWWPRSWHAQDVPSTSVEVSS
jgi:hypothetical protein